MNIHLAASASEAATEAAALLTNVAERAIGDRGRFRFAASGGRTPWLMYEGFARARIDWTRVEVWQVDERVVPRDSDERNALHLRSVLPADATVIEMPVEADDLDAAAAAYAETLPDPLDLVHLGLGADGHTASLPPGHPLADSARLVGISEIAGTRRMTLTPAAIGRAGVALWLVTGTDKREALEHLLTGDPSLPAATLGIAEQHLFTDVPPGV